MDRGPSFEYHFSSDITVNQFWNKCISIHWISALNIDYIIFWPALPSLYLWWKTIGMAWQGCPQSWGFAPVCSVISQSSHRTHTEWSVMISVHIPLQQAGTFSWATRGFHFPPWAADSGLLSCQVPADKLLFDEFKVETFTQDLWTSLWLCISVIYIFQSSFHHHSIMGS